MGVVFVNGNLAVKETGTLYTWTISAGSSNLSDDAKIITPPNGLLEITKVEGSIFDTYYVSGYVSASGIVAGGVESYYYKCKFTINDYEQGKSLINKTLEHIRNSDFDEDCKNLLYQQQYASVFSLMEHFLSCSFVGHICNNKEAYHKVLDSGFLQEKFRRKRHILNGPDNIKKELLFIKLANMVVYHNQKSVKELFDTAFGIDVDLSPLENQLTIRNHIAHRFGYTDSSLGGKLIITDESVRSLLSQTDVIVEKTLSQLPILPSNMVDLSLLDYLLC